jgi:hypothetical protein
MVATRKFGLLGILTFLVTSFLDGPAAGLEIIRTAVEIEFPDQIEFSLEAQSDMPIQGVELEFGLPSGACITDINRVEPEDFTQGMEIEASWTWDMRRTGSLPPGARVWWRWYVVDTDGREVRTETQWLTWLDPSYEWRTTASGELALHWYDGPISFADKLLQAAVQSQIRLEEDIGAVPEDRVDIYVYATTEAMREAILFEPGWTGALAYPSYRIVIIGVNQENLDWGMDTIAHELAHVVVGSLVSHCYSTLPTWLNEGLATYAEGELDPTIQRLLEESIADDTLFSIRSLSDGFTEQTDRAYLSYAQSYSIIKFLVETYGRTSMHKLLEALQAGYSDDKALLQVYGFDIDGLDTEWRASVGALARVEPQAMEPTPTAYPTLQPLAAPPIAMTKTPNPVLPLPILSESPEDPRSEVSVYLCLISLGLFSGMLLIALIVVVRHLNVTRRGS